MLIIAEITGSGVGAVGRIDVEVHDGLGQRNVKQD